MNTSGLGKISPWQSFGRLLRQTQMHFCPSIIQNLSYVHLHQKRKNWQEFLNFRIHARETVAGPWWWDRGTGGKFFKNFIALISDASITEIISLRGLPNTTLRNWSAKGEGGIPPKSVNRNTVPPYGRLQDFFAKYFFGFLSSSSRTRARAVWSLGCLKFMSLAMMMICRTFISQTSNRSSSGSRRARQEPKKGKSSKYNSQNDGHIMSCPVIHIK